MAFHTIKTVFSNISCGPYVAVRVKALKYQLTTKKYDENHYPILDTRISGLRPPSVTLTVPPLDSETGWTGELWSKTNILNWQNSDNSILLFFFAKKFLLQNFQIF